MISIASRSTLHRIPPRGLHHSSVRWHCDSRSIARERDRPKTLSSCLEQTLVTYLGQCVLLLFVDGTSQVDSRAVRLREQDLSALVAGVTSPSRPHLSCQHRSAPMANCPRAVECAKLMWKSPALRVKYSRSSCIRLLGGHSDKEDIACRIACSSLS
eukprot:6232607-Amphidinium_carterae.2